jgi:phosphohistidine phosphatase
MKRLILTRHGQAEDVNIHVKDFDRNLTTKGYMQAQSIGEKLKSLNLKIDFIIHSSAKRTTQTSQIINNEISTKNLKVISEVNLYICTIEKIEDVLMSNEYEHADTIMIIGHNNGLSDFYNHLLKNHLYHTLSTCETAIIRLDIKKWEDLYNRPSTMLEHLFKA